MAEKNSAEVIGFQALGMIETHGLVASIEAADTMAKASNVEVLNKRAIGGGYITILVRGDVGAVRTALGAGKKAAGKIGRVVSTRIIPGPHIDLEKLLPESVSD